MSYFLGSQSRNIRFLRTLIKKILLYTRIQALNINGAPGWPVGAQRTTKNSKKTTKMSFFWVYSEVTSDSRDFDKANVIAC